MKPILSVIIPVYNIKNYLEECLNSVINQTLKEIEIILVDDGSTDGSAKICDDFASKDNRIIVVHQKNQGAGMARNAGIEIANGKYITFTDGDDYLETSAFETLIKAITSHNLDAIRLSYNTFKEVGQFSHTIKDGRLEIFESNSEIRQIQLSTFSRPWDKSVNDINLGGSPWGLIIKANIIKDNNIRFLSEREIISEDYIFNYDCLNHVSRLAKSYDTLYHYRITPNSITRSPKLDNVVRTIATSKLMTEKFCNDGFSDSAKFYAMGFCIEVLRVHLKNVFISAMPLSSKLEWAKSQSQLPYFKTIFDQYPWQLLSLKHKLGFYLFAKGHMLSLYTLIVGQERVRNILKR